MDIIVTTNSPGEVVGWVKPFAYYAKKRFPESTITVFVTPCVFGTGLEKKIVTELSGVDNACSPKEYLSYLLLGRRPALFSPKGEGFVLFLGGDLAHACLLGRRLNLPVFAYTEGHRSWRKSISLFFLPKEVNVREGEEEKIRIIGNPMLDSVDLALQEEPPLSYDQKVIALFPGSRLSEVLFMVPYFHAFLKDLQEDVKVVISRSPFIEEGLLESCLDALGEGSWDVLSTGRYSLMREASLALTIPGTSSLELAYLKCPALVLLPLDKPWEIPLQGLPGLIGSLPLLGKALKKWLVPYTIGKMGHVALPNLLVGERVLPEMVGILDPKEVLSQVERLLAKKEEIDWERLKGVIGEGGATKVMLEEIATYLNQ